MRLVTPEAVVVPAREGDGTSFAVGAIFVFALIFIILWAVSRAGDVTHREIRDSHSTHTSILTDQGAKLAVIGSVVDRVSNGYDNLVNKVDRNNDNIISLNGNLNTQFSRADSLIAQAADRVIDVGQNQGSQTFARVYPDPCRDRCDHGGNRNTNININDINTIVDNAVTAAVARRNNP